MAKAEIIDCVTVTITDGNGNITRQFTEKNTLTNGDPTTTYNGRVMMLMTLSGDDDGGSIGMDSSSVLDNMQLGTGTADNTGLQTPITAAPTTTEIAATLVWDYTTPSQPKITYTCVWDSTFDALTVSEAVLYNDFNDVFAYKNFSPALTKTTDGTIQIDWSITIT